jgi:hypothetical protein
MESPGSAAIVPDGAMLSCCSLNSPIAHVDPTDDRRRHSGVFTVNASNYAVPLYEALGFERTAPMQVSVVRYNPMRLVLVQ